MQTRRMQARLQEVCESKPTTHPVPKGPQEDFLQTSREYNWGSDFTDLMI